MKGWSRALLPILVLAAAAPAALGPRYGGVLRVRVDSRPGSGAPVVAPGDGARLVAAAIHETLVGIEPGGYPTPALAETWTSTAGGREWRLALRREAHFHDGHPAQAADVVRSLRRFLRSESPAAAVAAARWDGGAGFRAGSSQELPGLGAPDPGVVWLRLVAPHPLPFAPLAAPAAAITSLGGAGLGPFVPTLWRSGSLVLTPFAGHLRGRPFLDGVRVLWPSPDATIGAEAADLTPGSSQSGPLVAVLLLVLDPERPPFDSLSARITVATAIDRGELVRRFLPGGAATPSLLPPSLLPPLPETSPSPLAGRLSGQVTLSVTRDVPRLASQRVVAHLSALGLAVTAEPVDPDQDQTPGAAARLRLFTPEVPEAELALRELQRMAPAVPAAGEALERAASERDPDLRRVLLHRAEAALRSAASLVPLAAVPLPFAARPGVHGAVVDHQGRLVLEDAWLEP
jgi:hypothetical protein